MYVTLRDEYMYDITCKQAIKNAQKSLKSIPRLQIVADLVS